MQMKRSAKLLSLLGAGALVAGTAAIGTAGASSPTSPVLTSVPTANSRSAGYGPATKLSPELEQVVVAQGSNPLENPSPLTSYYGYDNDVLNEAGQPVMVPSPSSAGKEAHKTEPDKNTYLVFKNSLAGADPNYDYGTHFLFQGHEGGAGGAGYITRVNLDADHAHRVTLMATEDAFGNQLATIDGSTWDPFAKKLLFTTENAGAGTYTMTPDYPPVVTDVSGALGRGGYEGIQDDSAGDLWIAEDIGGANKLGTKAKQPNSYIYRYVPKSPGDFLHGKLQVLQVLNASGEPITYASQEAVNSPDQLALHTYGKSFKTRWITIHDTATDGNAPYVSGPLAKAASATPFKRPENGVFQPDTQFTKFFFDETGDTSKESVENENGGWGSIFQLSQSSPTASMGTLQLFYKGDESHASFDNVTFLSKNSVTFVEDAGDPLHQQRNALDSGWVFNVTQNYGEAKNQPVRWLAEGRDASATLDADNGGFGSNEGDNEITGAVVSDGKTGVNGILGTDSPDLTSKKWRWFYTQQHGDNRTYEVRLNR
jgi:hypothetical protein